MQAKFKVGDPVKIVAKPSGPIQEEEMLKSGIVGEVRTNKIGQTEYRVKNKERWGFFAEADLELEKF